MGNLMTLEEARTLAASLGIPVDRILNPRVSGGDGTTDPPIDPDDENPTPPNPGAAPRGGTQPPVQRFSRADLDAAAADARTVERTRLTERHRVAMEGKDNEITRLTEEVNRLNDVIAGFDRETDEQLAGMLESLPAAVRRFAPSANASGEEKRKFLREAPLAAAELTTVPPVEETPPLAPSAPIVPPSPPRAPGTRRVGTGENGVITVEDEKRERLKRRPL